MAHELTYTHTRNLFQKNEYKSFVAKYFKDVDFLGCECGNWNPSIKVSNWNEVKDSLPKSYQPIEVKEYNG